MKHYIKNTKKKFRSVNILPIFHLLSLFLVLFSLSACKSNSSSTASHVSSTESYEESLESTTSEEIDEPSESGIVVLNNLDTSTVQLDLLNPETGQISMFRTFTLTSSIQGDVIRPIRYIRDESYISKNDGYSPYFQRQAFDADYTKMAVQITKAEDGGSNVGYITSDGNLVDVSEKISGNTGGFSDQKNNHISPIISKDGYFYFIDSKDKELSTLVKIPLDDLTEEKMEKVATGYLWENSYSRGKGSAVSFDYLVDDTGNVVSEVTDAPSSMPSWKASDNQDTVKIKSPSGDNFCLLYTGGSSDITSQKTIVSGLLDETFTTKDTKTFVDWINDIQFLTKGFSIVKAFEEPVNNWDELNNAALWENSESESYDNKTTVTYFMEATPILPENERNNTKPIPSADGETIAFLSSKTESIDSKQELYTIPTSGGEPTLISEFNHYSQYELYSISFIDWR